MFRFENPEYLFFILLLPLLVLVQNLLHKRSQSILKNLGNVQTLRKNIIGQSAAVKTQTILWLFCILFIILTLANPQYGIKKQNVQTGNAQIIIALDASNSMLVDDIKPNRLARAQLLIRQITEKIATGKTGLISFAGEAYLQSPLTTDIATIHLLSSIIHPDQIPTQGTDLSAAINLALKSFPEKDGYHKLLILMTDGEDHEGETLEAAKKADELGVSIITIPIGTEEGGYITDPKMGYKTDKEGNAIRSIPNRVLLREIAEAASGEMLEIQDSDLLIKGIQSRIKHIIKKDLSFQLHNEYESRFQWPLALAVFLMLFIILKPHFKEI